MKNGNLYQKLKSANKDYRVALAKRYEIVLAMQRELEEVTRPIIEKYESILNAMENETFEKFKKSLHIAGIYHDYGRFYTSIITNFFAVFLSYVEGEKFIPYRHYENFEISEGSMIIKEEVDKQHDTINYDTLDKLYQNGDVILLDNGFSNMVDFYNYVGEPSYKFGKFNYLREFVNRLIQYRIDNDKKDVKSINEEDLYSFASEFLSAHPDLVAKNKDKREQMLMSQSEEQSIISQCKKLELIPKNNN